MKKLFLIPLFMFNLAASSQILAATYYVAVDGNDLNPGTITQPWGTWQKAFDTAVAGDTVYFRGGVWYPADHTEGNFITIIKNSGTKNNRIYFLNYPGEHPILDCSLVDTVGNDYNSGMFIDEKHFINFRGLTIRNIYQPHSRQLAAGIGAWASSNLHFENITLHDIGGRGFSYMGATGFFGVEYDSTYWINCDVYNCIDSLSEVPGNGGDGWKMDQEDSTYFYLYGCRSWNNSDDGFDISGSATLIFDNCWAFNMQFPGALDANGFKFGGVRDSLTEPPRIVRNCISAFNNGSGFYDLEYEPYYRNNSRVYNNTIYKCGTGIGISRNSLYPDTSLSVYRNNIVYEPLEIDAGGRPYNLAVFDYYTESHNTWDYGEPGSLPRWVPTDSVTVTDDDFVSLDGSQLTLPRKEDGSLPDIDFLKLSPNSDLIDAGTFVGLPFNGSSPDIGAFEFDAATAVADDNLLASTKLSLYPNPTNSMVNIEYVSEQQNRITISVFNILGQIVKTEEHNVTVGKSNQIKLTLPLSSGIYIIQVNDGVKSFVGSVVNLK
ncbi:MAG: T9SS type A sorting domain-containing protein [Ignavibacteriae bacterium]|nr:T9SS C-terminal target domain-containing protein [Ignavibacteriota bacterium]NOH00053.1 T9SS type A sorting domain-containing protein [Ignavibacteriota bacterium]